MTATTNAHRTRAWRNLSGEVLGRAAALDLPCVRCGRPIDYALPRQGRWGATCDHLDPLVTGGNPLPSIELLGPAHRRCNSKHGGSYGAAITNNKRRVKNERYEESKNKNVKRDVDHSSEGGSDAPVFRASYLRYPAVEYPGDIPNQYSEPRYLTDMPSDAAGSLAGEWAAFIEGPDGPGMTLRPWQREVLERALAVDADGRLIFRDVIVSTPRQSGKGWLLSAVAAARCEHAARFGQGPQQVLHVANNLQAARKIHMLAWRWASNRGYTVRAAMGSERIIWPDDSSWDLTTSRAIWGSSAHLAFADECWDLAPEVITSALVPTMVERDQSQLWLLSTANEHATPLMSDYRARALAGVPRTFLAEWSAPDDADPNDPEVWRAASPHWSRARFDLMSSARGSAGFRYQWLNRWSEGGARGLTWGEVWSGLLRSERKGYRWSGPVVAGLESDPGARSWGAAVTDGRHVDTAAFDRLGHALDWLRARTPEVVLAHESVVQRIGEGEGLPMVKVSTAESLAARSAFQDAVPSLSWSGVLAAQLATADVSRATDQIDARRSSGPVAAVKASAWAVWSARVRPVVAPQIW